MEIDEGLLRDVDEVSYANLALLMRSSLAKTALSRSSSELSSDSLTWPYSKDEEYGAWMSQGKLAELVVRLIEEQAQGRWLYIALSGG